MADGTYTLHRLIIRLKLLYPCIGMIPGMIGTVIPERTFFFTSACGCQSVHMSTCSAKKGNALLTDLSAFFLPFNKDINVKKHLRYYKVSSSVNLFFEKSQVLLFVIRIRVSLRVSCVPPHQDIS